MVPVCTTTEYHCFLGASKLGTKCILEKVPPLHLECNFLSWIFALNGGIFQM